MIVTSFRPLLVASTAIVAVGTTKAVVDRPYVTMRMDVNERGVVNRCDVVSTDIKTDLPHRTCSAVSKAAHFRPAFHGKAFVRRTVTRTVRFITTD